MEHATLAPPTLFDLLARTWQRPAAIGSAIFNADQTAVAFACADGSLAIAPVADAEPPTRRIRRDLETGRTTIRPRSKPVLPATLVGAFAEGPPIMAPYGQSGFLAGGADGRLHQVTARGQVVRLAASRGPIVAIDRHAATRRVAVAAGAEIVIYAEDLGDTLRLAAPALASGVAFSPDGSEVAAAHLQGLSIWKANGASGGRRDLPFAGHPAAISWSPDGNWIACSLAAGGFQLVRLADGANGAVSGYPAPVRALGWSRAAGALVTSGAFRVTAWSMECPPLGGDMAGALVTGRAGLVPLETVAAHPLRNLVAAGYANGLLNIAQIGGRDELLIRPDGGAVTALAWSKDGSHLAFGAADGTAALIGFPPQIFK
ncbi:MAG TPA: High-affnity carbon uptake protein Hat/HatR [Paracoccaceae bacterium]|nr:High-affnity carbon uptake protein Hat/HatR [Paracoccaceae bacterium]